METCIILKAYCQCYSPTRTIYNSILPKQNPSHYGRAWFSLHAGKTLYIPTIHVNVNVNTCNSVEQKKYIHTLISYSKLTIPSNDQLINIIIKLQLISYSHGHQTHRLQFCSCSHSPPYKAEVFSQ